MRSRFGWLAGGAAVATLAQLLDPSPGLGQDRQAVRAEWALVSQYHWRGIRRSDTPQAQPAASIGHRVHDLVWLSIGGWATLELIEADGHRRSDLRQGHWGLAERDAWVQAEINRPGWSLGAGYLAAWYSGSGRDQNTGELFARAELISSVPAPRFEIWHDLNDGRGTYLEAGLAWIVANPLDGPGVNLAVTALTGYAAGVRSLQHRLSGLPGFDRNGFTHGALRLDLRVTPTLGRFELSLDLRPELQASFDPATKAGCGVPESCLRSFRGWIAGSIGVALPRRGRP